MNSDQTKPSFWQNAKEIVIQGLIVIAAILCVILVSWGIIKLVPAVISSVQTGGTSLSSIFKPKESLTVSASPQVAANGTPISLSWTHVSRTSTGTYSISYDCAPGLAVKIRNNAGGYQTFACGKQLPVGDVAGIILAATSSQNRLVQTPVTVTFTDSATGAAGVAGQVPVTITNDSLPFTSASENSSASSAGTETAVATPAKTSTYTTQRTQYGKPDLKLTILGTGVVDPSTGQFVGSQAFGANQKAAVRFSVSNIGARSSGSWTWSAVFPDGQVYNPARQASLAPGSSVVFTLGFDNYGSGDGKLTISVDDIQAVPDANRNNNAATIPFSLTGTGYSYGTYTYTSYPYSTGTYVTPIYPTTYNYGAADLSARILSVDGNAAYQNGYYSGIGQSHTVRVEVTNIGTSASGAWSYTAQLPISCQNVAYNNSYYGGSAISCNGNQVILTGYSQSPLAPNGSIILTIRFTNGSTGGYSCSYNQYPYGGYTPGCTGYAGNYYSGSGAFVFTANTNGFPELRTDNNTATAYIQ